jgi:anti-sigma factor RsiW
MKGCSSWTEAITDCALGKTPDTDFAAHLAICPQCRNALRNSQAIAARMDEALHRSAAVEPPLYGPERVMARLTLTHRRAWWGWAAAGSAVLAMLIAIIIWGRRPAPVADVNALSTWRSPTRALLSPPVAAAWSTRPRLGEEFFNIGQGGEIHAQ